MRQAKWRKIGGVSPQKYWGQEQKKTMGHSKPTPASFIARAGGVRNSIRPLGPALIHEIRMAANFSMPLGNSRFKLQVQKALGRKAGQVKRGRLRKESRFVDVLRRE